MEVLKSLPYYWSIMVRSLMSLSYLLIFRGNKNGKETGDLAQAYSFQLNVLWEILLHIPLIQLLKDLYE